MLIARQVMPVGKADQDTVEVRLLQQKLRLRLLNDSPVCHRIVVDHALLLEEGMHAQNRVRITLEMAAAGRRGQIVRWIRTIKLDYKVAVLHVDAGRLTRVLPAEELGQSLLLVVGQFALEVLRVKPSVQGRCRDIQWLQ